ncbi:MAG TPA: hypothetical protein VKU82_13165 [Planctomycetaceae bacterium]|nr:hypothetical protein [Planctomycetaceae bacterium]
MRQPASQHAGPKLRTYSTGPPSKNQMAVLFAHLSRRLTIRTVSQTAIAAYATAKTGRTIAMR